MAKPFAGLLLLLGMLGAELALFGHDWAGAVAAALWLGCAAVLVFTRSPEAPRQPVAARSRPATGRSAHVLG